MLNENYQLSVPVGKDDHVSGDLNNAKIVLVEYGDYQCSYCGEAFPIVQQLQKDFGDKLAFVFRNFPLGEIHPHALHAAEAAEVAADQGKFWEMHDLLYENQDRLGDADLHAMAKMLGLDTEAFDEAMQKHIKTEKIKADFMSGVESGVNGTPSFFVNNEIYEGDWSYEAFKNFLTGLL